MSFASRKSPLCFEYNKTNNPKSKVAFESLFPQWKGRRSQREGVPSPYQTQSLFHLTRMCVLYRIKNSSPQATLHKLTAFGLLTIKRIWPCPSAFEVTALLNLAWAFHTNTDMHKELIIEGEKNKTKTYVQICSIMNRIFAIT